MESLDPLHVSIITYNLVILYLKQFYYIYIFNWFISTLSSLQSEQKQGSVLRFYTAITEENKIDGVHLNNGC